jgi:hypothetical protein
MSGPSDPASATSEQGFLAPRAGSGPVDHCFRCGVETAPGVGLCEEHNQGHLRGPSATQMHATIFVGIAIAVVALFVLANLTVTTSGPFSSPVTSATGTVEGGVSLAFTITNEGADEGVPDCRVTRDGVPRPDDLAFRVAPLAAGASVTIEQELAAPPARPGYDLEALTVVCT